MMANTTPREAKAILPILRMVSRALWLLGLMLRMYFSFAATANW